MTARVLDAKPASASFFFCFLFFFASLFLFSRFFFLNFASALRRRLSAAASVAEKQTKEVRLKILQKKMIDRRLLPVLPVWFFSNSGTLRRSLIGRRFRPMAIEPGPFRSVQRNQMVWTIRCWSFLKFSLFCFIFFFTVWRACETRRCAFLIAYFEGRRDAGRRQPVALDVPHSGWRGRGHVEGNGRRWRLG